MTANHPTSQQNTDITTGWPALLRLVELDIGQSIAMSGGKVLAVESVEGTDAMIDRAGALSGGDGWTLFKSPRPDHDMRFDVPAIGLMTIERLARAGATCLALRTGRVIMIDKPQVLDAAERAGIAIVGVNRSCDSDR